MTKSCGTCSHGMESEFVSQVYCIAHPAVPLWTPNGVVTHFPMMLKHGKCDEFKQGKTQAMGRPE